MVQHQSHAEVLGYIGFQWSADYFTTNEHFTGGSSSKEKPAGCLDHTNRKAHYEGPGRPVSTRPSASTPLLGQWLTIGSAERPLEVGDIRVFPEGFTEAMLGHTATVFGATGFLGRYIVNRLGTQEPSQSRCGP